MARSVRTRYAPSIHRYRRGNHVKVAGKGLTISGETYQSLRAGILGGEIPPGDKVRTQALCERFGVSLGAVREALSQLMAEGLVLSEAHRGFTVAPISIEDLKDLTRVRTEIEVMCLTWSMQAGGLEWESEVIAASHRLSKTHRLDEQSAASPQFMTAHDAYHSALVSACGSPRLLQIRKQLYDQSERYRKMESALPRDRNPDEEHKKLADAVIARNIPLATKLLKAHIALTTDNIIKAMEKRVTKAPRKAGAVPATARTRGRPRTRPASGSARRA
ncbi:MAG TPA: FCD domain-containing protein [Steroidobacter sp.]